MIEQSKENLQIALEVLRSSEFLETVLPHIVDKRLRMTREVLASDINDDVHRGWVQALEWVENLPSRFKEELRQT